jgi:hypothetical protein
VGTGQRSRRSDVRARRARAHGGEHHPRLRAHAIAAAAVTIEGLPMTWKLIAGVGVGIVAVIVVVALVTGGESKSDKAMAQVCDARADISKQIQTLQGLTPATAKGQVKTSVQAIGDDLKSIAGARKDLSSERRDQVQSANSAFVSGVRDQLGGVTDLASLQTAGGEIKQAAQQLAATYRTTYAKLDCS